MYILLAIVLFGMLIFVHELGHFMAAKLLGVRVNEFAICMGPAIWQKRVGETGDLSSLTSSVPFLTMSGCGPKTHFLTSAERKCLQSIKGNSDEILQEVRCWRKA